jgi:hypothetical protein
LNPKLPLADSLETRLLFRTDLPRHRPQAARSSRATLANVQFIL